MGDIICVRCHTPKDPKDFSPDARNRTGKQSQCRVCVREARAETHDANRALGRCFCGESRAEGSTNCEHHRKKADGHYRRYRQDPQRVEQMLRWNRDGQLKAKLAAFDAYGGRICKCCGETHIEFLSIDHIGGVHAPDEPRHTDGRHRTGSGLYRWLKKKGYPAGYRVLCMNCNFALGHAGYCPHGTLDPSPTEGGSMIEPGDQRLTSHGVLCTVATLARDSETQGVVVVYTSGVGVYWVMSQEDFEQGPEAPNTSPPVFTTPLGTFQHFKGTIYEVVTKARDPRSLTNLIVYESPEGLRWVRPERMFEESVTWPDGVVRPRFVRETPPG